MMEEKSKKIWINVLFVSIALLWGTMLYIQERALRKDKEAIPIIEPTADDVAVITPTKAITPTPKSKATSKKREKSKRKH